jgi:hypothetical protein
MADVTFCPFKEKRYFVFLVIKWFVLPFNGRNLFDSTLLKRKPAEVTLSGELKNGKRFKGTTKIIITGWNVKHRWKWNRPDWLNSEKDLDNWWNKEKDFEDWWKKTIKKHERQNNRKEKGDSRS